jgi:hypothetical protein
LEFEYETRVISGGLVFGRDKVDTGDLEDELNGRGKDGWELAAAWFDANLEGRRDAHLLIFKRAKGG